VRDVPPVALSRRAEPPDAVLPHAYVVLGAFTYPAGSYGSRTVTFYIPKGIPSPAGNPDGAIVHDFNRYRCNGPGLMCGTVPLL